MEVMWARETAGVSADRDANPGCSRIAQPRRKTIVFVLMESDRSQFTSKTNSNLLILCWHLAHLILIHVPARGWIRNSILSVLSLLAVRTYDTS